MQCTKKKTVFLFLLIFLVPTTTFLSVSQKQVNASFKKESFEKQVVKIRVERGDTLWDIAQRYRNNNTDIRFYIQEIKKCNGMASDKLIEGQFLIVPYLRKL